MLHPGEYYVGNTQNTSSTILTMHLENGAIEDIFQQTHDMTLSRNTIVDCTKITREIIDITRLQIAEAVITFSHDPLISRQDTGKTRTLNLFS